MWLIDEQGDAWGVNDPGLSRRYSTTRGGLELARFLVRNVGCLLVELKRGHVSVTFDHDGVSPIALTGLIMWLSDFEETPVAVVDCYGKIPTLYRKRFQAVTAFSDLIDRSHRPEPFICNAVPLASSVFAGSWRVTEEIIKSSMDAENRTHLLNTLFDGYYCFAERHATNDELVVTELGKSVRPMFGWSKKNCTFTDMHDKLYGSWIASTLRECIPGQTIAQLVSAPILWPGAEKPCLHHYSRIVISFEADNRYRMLSATIAHGSRGASLGNV